MICPRFTIPLLLVAIVAMTHPAPAAVVNDPTLITGPDAIDPAGAQELTDTELGGGTSQAKLESRAGFATIQDFTGLAGWNQVNGATNIFSHSASHLPDIRITMENVSGSLGVPQWGSGFNSPNHATSANSAIQLGFMGSPFTGTHRLTLDFGTYDAGGGTFTTDRSVDAASFTLNNVNGGSPNTTYDVEFRNSGGTTLHTTAPISISSHNSSPDNRPNVLVGHSTGLGTPAADQIARVVVTETRSGGGGSGNTMGIDDLGFTSPIPGVSIARLGADDTYIERDDRTTGDPTINDDNFGGSAQLKVFNRGVRDANSLLRFDLSSLANAEEILSARLFLTTDVLSDGTGGGQNQVELYRVDSADADWVEGSSDDTNEVGAASWNHEQSASVDWDGNFSGPPLGGISPVATDGLLATELMAADGELNEFLFTGDLSFLIDWANDPSQNAGFMLISPNGDDFSIFNAFHSSESSLVSARPILAIEFINAVPEPGSFGLWALGLIGVALDARRRRRRATR